MTRRLIKCIKIHSLAQFIKKIKIIASKLQVILQMNIPFASIPTMSEDNISCVRQSTHFNYICLTSLEHIQALPSTRQKMHSENERIGKKYIKSINTLICRNVHAIQLLLFLSLPFEFAPIRNVCVQFLFDHFKLQKSQKSMFIHNVHVVNYLGPLVVI